MLNPVQIQAIIKGTGYTLIIATVAVLLGIVFGMLVAIGRISKINWSIKLHGSMSGSLGAHRSYCNYL